MEDVDALDEAGAANVFLTLESKEAIMAIGVSSFSSSPNGLPNDVS